MAKVKRKKEQRNFQENKQNKIQTRKETGMISFGFGISHSLEVNILRESKSMTKSKQNKKRELGKIADSPKKERMIPNMISHISHLIARRRE